MQKQLDDLRTNLARIEESIQMKNATMKENRRKVAEITKELTSIGSGGAALEGVEQELAGAVSVWRKFLSGQLNTLMPLGQGVDGVS